MAIPFPGLNSPSASTEVPLEMLAACHGRIRHQCNVLRRLAAHLETAGNDAEARSAATAIVRYFDTAAPDHHADEEEDLFPALLESVGGSDAVCIRDMIQRLDREHRRLEAAWAHLRQILLRIAAGESAALPQRDVDAFVNPYLAHIQLEDDELLPMANRLLDQPAIDRIGRAMRIRRGIRDFNL